MTTRLRYFILYYINLYISFRYLQIEWDTKKASTEGERVFDKDYIKGANPKCPQQTNFSDCGIYVLQYVKSFYEVRISFLVAPLLKGQQNDLWV